MPHRPYFHHSSTELEAEARANWNSVQALNRVLEELHHRTTAKAQRLEREVSARVVALGGEQARGGGNGKGSGESAGGNARADSRSEHLVRELTARAVRAEQQVRELRERLQRAEAQVRSMQGQAPAGASQLYAEVGLHPSCPDFLFKAARRAFRKEYHPDALSDRPREEQLEAQELFKKYDSVFESIQRTG